MKRIVFAAFLMVSVYYSVGQTPEPVSFTPFKKGMTHLFVGVPYINIFHIKPQGEPAKSQAGFLGFSLGVDRYYKDNRFIKVTANFASNFELPFPFGVDHPEDHEMLTTIYVLLTDNFQLRNFSIGYGFSYSENNWLYIYGGVPSDKPTLTKSTQSIGLVLNSSYRIKGPFYIGVTYRPNLFTVQPATEFQYEHLISFDFGWRIRVAK